jgi:putative transcriptional regulator
VDESRNDGTIAPALLISMPQLNDPNFSRTVVLLCEHTPEGAWGLVLNRPTGRSAASAVEVDTPIPNDNGLEIWMGGPVEPYRGCILLGDRVPEIDLLQIREGLYISASSLLLRRLLEEPLPPPRARLLVGYAGWGPGQLDSELQASAWLISDVDPTFVFDVGAPEMWETAIRRIGADPTSLQMSPGVH